MAARFFHGDTIEGFLAMPEAQIVGNLTTAHTIKSAIFVTNEITLTDSVRSEIS